ncbi:MAG TPA: hypothetical protein ENJ77_00045 [Candidatus Moranbacteria bacterium]|nr:hypothetical protein [Candidatus Moranbacteria bacterium]
MADVNVSWDVVGVTRAAADASPSENKGKSSAKPASAGEKKELMQVLLVAAPKKDVSRYESYLKGTQLILRALELESFALVRSLIGEDEGTFLLVDIGAESTNIVLVKNGIVYLSRNIGVGGVGVTSAVQEALGISEDRAESHKREVSLLSGSQAIAVPALEAVVEEVRRVIKAASDMSIDGIVLAGGTAQMRDLKKYFADKLGREVVLGNPWARINCDERLKSVLASTGGGFSIAVGLALRGLEEYKRQ